MSSEQIITPHPVGRVSPEGVTRQLAGDAEKTHVGLRDNAANPTYGAEWPIQKISSLGEFDRGKSKHRPRDAAHLYGGSYPFIQTGDVTNSDGRITSFRQTYSEAGLAQSRLWPVGTLAITIAANIAETALLTFPACFPDSVVGFTADPKKADVRFV